MKAKNLILVAALSFAGCMSAETKQLVRDQAAVADADYRDWKAGKLSPAQVETHMLDHARASAALNYAVNGVPVPPAYVASPAVTK